MWFLYDIFMVILAVVLALFPNGSLVAASHDATEAPQQLPFCNDDVQQSNKNAGLIYVSTLDGRISALDLLADGELKWDISTSPGQMISSSIQNLELTNNGQWVRMIPSLDGSIYKFDGDTVEPIPINADNLLSSSFKFSDDLVISGGKETISYGVSAHSGRIIYECSMKGCVNSTTEIDANELNDDSQVSPTVIDDVIVVRRQTQTVRAIEPRTGEERWNFSVGHHELELFQSSDDCHSTKKLDDDVHSFLLDLDIKVIVPDGVICAVRKTAPHIILWKHKFEHPIVNVWKRDDQQKLVTLDLFRVASDLWQDKRSALTQPQPGGATNADENVMPSIYIGMFKRQLYIQESDQLRMLQSKFIDHMRNGNGEKKSFGRIPWRPIDASSMTEIGDGDEDKVIVPTASPRNDLESSALSVLYGSEYVNGNGFYLYSKNVAKDDKTAICDKETNGSNGDKDNFEELIINPAIRSEFYDRVAPLVNLFPTMSYWWREISLIVLTVLIFNVILTQRRPNDREVVIVERYVENKVPANAGPHDGILQAIEYHPDRKPSESNTNESDATNEFESRFQNEFDLLQCLGKGGFGVVFEVKNKLDEGNYAVKRIALPRNVQSRERVMREVKTLANCDHQNIVRYFHSWVESPPPGWQDVEDKKWLDRCALSHSIDIESPSSEEPTSNRFGANGICHSSFTTHSYKKEHLNSIISDLHTNECVNFDEIIRKTNFNENKHNGNIGVDDDEDDSFIVFASEANEHSNADESNDLENSYDYGETDTTNSSRLEHESSIEKSNGNARKKKTLLDRKAQFQEFGEKKRSSSMSENVSKQNATSHEFSVDINQLNSKCDVISEKPSDASTSVFKKTHRRPLSLDLTSGGSVKVDVLPELRTSLPASYLYIQMQLCRKQSLKDWLLENDTTMRANQSLAIFKQIVEGVEYVHLKGLIHRDLKPSNIFFSLDGQIKIGDFGLVTDMCENLTPCGYANGLPPCAIHTAQVGTHLYMSPEQLLGRPYNYKVDIYSLGVILYELLVVFGTEMERINTIKQLRSNQFPNDFEHRFPNEFKLLKMMLGKNPSERPTTYGIRGRPPFDEITEEIHHFELPPRSRDSRNSSNSLSTSGSSSSGFQKSRSRNKI